jgi:hypothetical protein
LQCPASVTASLTIPGQILNGHYEVMRLAAERRPVDLDAERRPA